MTKPNEGLFLRNTLGASQQPGHSFLVLHSPFFPMDYHMWSLQDHIFFLWYFFFFNHSSISTLCLNSYTMLSLSTPLLFLLYSKTKISFLLHQIFTQDRKSRQLFQVTKQFVSREAIRWIIIFYAILHIFISYNYLIMILLNKYDRMVVSDKPTRSCILLTFSSLWLLES